MFTSGQLFCTRSLTLAKTGSDSVHCRICLTVTGMVSTCFINRSVSPVSGCSSAETSRGSRLSPSALQFFFFSSLNLNGVLINSQGQGPSLYSSCSHCWHLPFLFKQSQERFMISVDFKHLSLQVLVNYFHSIHNGNGFFLN